MIKIFITCGDSTGYLDSMKPRHKTKMRLLLLISLMLPLSGCTVLTIADAAASVVIKTVETAVDWVIPD